MRKILRGPPYILGWLFLAGSIVFNAYLSVSFLGFKERVEEFYQKDFVDVKIISEQLVLDIEKKYNEKLPPVELNIRLSDYSDTGIRYKDNSGALQLFLPPGIVGFDINQKRAYLAHEFGHYILGHIDQQNFSSYSFSRTRNLTKEVEADLFALEFSNLADLSSAINKLVWDEQEKKTRLDALSGAN